MRVGDFHVAGTSAEMTPRCSLSSASITTPASAASSFTTTPVRHGPDGASCGVNTMCTASEGQLISPVPSKAAARVTPASHTATSNFFSLGGRKYSNCQVVWHTNCQRSCVGLSQHLQARPHSPRWGDLVDPHSHKRRALTAGTPVQQSKARACLLYHRPLERWYCPHHLERRQAGEPRTTPCPPSYPPQP